MAFSEFERKRHERDLRRFIEARRPPPHIRPKLDLGFRIVGQSVELFEIRPDWQKPSVIRESSFAKATYVATRKHWRIFWKRQDLKWHGYEPHPEAATLEEVLAVVGRDEYHCFFG
jgi:hypothetical protein